MNDSKITIPLTSKNLHMNEQIFELFTRMTETKVEVADGIYITTKPYCNCREQGFVLCVEILGGCGVSGSNYAFYEHRNSDSICVLKWEGRTNITGAVTPDDIPTFTNKWDVTKMWDWQSFDEVIEWFKNELTILSNEVISARENKKENRAI